MDGMTDNALPHDHGLATPDASPPSAAEAQRIVAGWVDIPESRRNDLAGALTAAARICALPDDAIVLEPAFLNPRLFLRSPAAFGITPKRFSNILSALRYVLRRLGRHAPQRVPLSPAWHTLCSRLAPHHEWNALIGFARYCSSLDLEPSAVRQETLAEYEAFLAGRTLCRSPASRARATLHTWNRARIGIEGWPAVQLRRPGMRDQYTLPFDAYPPSFQIDVDAFANRLAGSDPETIFSDALFEEDSAVRPHRSVRPGTVATRLFAIRQAAAALVRSGFDPTDIRTLRDLVEPAERAKTILHFFWERGGRQANSNSAGVGEVLRQIALHHCRLPAPEAARIARWRQVATPKRNPGMTEKNRARLRPMMDLRSRAMLLHLPAELMRRAMAGGDSSRRWAAMARNATALEILLTCPLRISNLRALRLDRHLQHADARSGRISHLSIPGSEVKNGAPYDWPLPEETAKLIERWLARFRPLLADPGNPYLLPAAKGKDGSMSLSGLGVALSKTIADETGLRVNPHLLRHFAAANYLGAQPGQYEVVRRVLNHHSIDTTVDVYCGLETDSAARHFDETVLRERRTTRSIATAAFRGRARRRLPRPIGAKSDAGDR